MTKEAFLARLRERLSAPPHPNVAHPVVCVDGVPPVGYARDLSDPVAAFRAAATEVGATVRRVTDPGEVVREVVTAVGARVVAVSRDPEAVAALAVLRGLDVEVVEIADAARADLGITGAAYGIAATGTLVLDAGRAGGRGASLLPPVHLALLAADRIVPDAAALFRGDGFGASLPSQLVLVTGPSRTGDIELVLTLGVHGPGAVWIGVLERS